MSIEKAWSYYVDSCKCGERQTNNCAHYLSNAFINAGYSDLDGGTGANWRIVNGFCVCPAGRPIRAKEMRDWFSRTFSEQSGPPTNGYTAVYQERPSNGRGHVLIQKYSEGNRDGYRGTCDLYNNPDWKTMGYYH